MALVIEDGTGLEDAESFLTVADWRAYAQGVGFPEDNYEDDAVEQAARRAVMSLQGRYGAMWPGVKLRGRTQALDWPRDGAVDLAGDEIAISEVPREVKRAQAEFMMRELTAPNSLSPDTITQKVVSESVGPISVTYADNEGSIIPVVTTVDEILGALFKISFGTVIKPLARF